VRASRTPTTFGYASESTRKTPRIGVAAGAGFTRCSARGDSPESSGQPLRRGRSKPTARRTCPAPPASGIHLPGLPRREDVVRLVNVFLACISLGITGNTIIMKTAISLPDELFDEIDACARELKTSRSRLLAKAARDFLDRRRNPAAATSAWNRAIARAGQPGDEPAARAFRRRSKAVIRAAGR